MIIIYISIIFLICIITYLVYYTKNKYINVEQPPLNQLSSIECSNGFNQFEKYMKTPIANIQKTISLLERLLQLYDDLNTSVNDIPKLKIQLETIESFVNQQSNSELNDNLRDIKTSLENNNVFTKLSELDIKFNDFNSKISNIKIPDDIKTLLGKVEKSIDKFSNEIKQGQKVVGNIQQVDLTTDIQNIEVDLKKLSEIIDLNHEIKELINSLPRNIDTGVKTELKNFHTKYSDDVTKTFTNMNSILNQINMIKGIIENIKLHDIAQIINDISENKVLLTGLKTILDDVKIKIESIDINVLNKIQKNVEEIITQFKRVLDVLRPGARNLLQDGTIIIKNENDKEPLSINLNNGFYHLEDLQKIIRSKLKYDPNSFKIYYENNLCVVEYSRPFHIDNHLRDLIGLPRVEPQVFLKKYNASIPHKFDYVILETLVHKLSVDAIVKKIKNQMNNQIKIVNKLPTDVNAIANKLETLPDYEKIKTEIDKIPSFPKELSDAIHYIRENYTKSEMTNTIDMLFNLTTLNEEFKKYFRINMNDKLTVNKFFDTLDSKLSTEMSKMFTKINMEIEQKFQSLNFQTKDRFEKFQTDIKEMKTEILFNIGKTFQPFQTDLNEIKRIVVPNS